MNLKEYIEKAKKVLHEDAGSEGLVYILKYRGALPEKLGFEVEPRETKDNVHCAKITFPYPKDYGFALQVLKDLKIDVVGLELAF